MGYDRVEKIREGVSGDGLEGNFGGTSETATVHPVAASMSRHKPHAEALSMSGLYASVHKISTIPAGIGREAIEDPRKKETSEENWR